MDATSNCLDFGSTDNPWLSCV
jgi:hypothetical protein